mgnify:CR=1 FL=1
MVLGYAVLWGKKAKKRKRTLPFKEREKMITYTTPIGRIVRNNRGQWQMLGDKGWTNLRWVPENLKKENDANSTNRPDGNLQNDS